MDGLDAGPAGVDESPIAADPGAQVDPVIGATAAGRGKRRSVVAVLAAVVLASTALLAAIFSGSAGASGSKSLTASSPTVPAVQTVSFSVSASVAKGSSNSTLLSGSGAADLVNGDGSAALTVPALSSLLGGGTVNAVWQGTNVYVEVPALSKLTGKSWVEVSVAGLPGITSVGSTIATDLSDPSKLSGTVTALGGTVNAVGPAVLNGQSTTEYQATIPLNGLAGHLHALSSRAAPKVKPAKLKAGVKALQHLGVSGIPVTAWVGSDGRLVQVSTTLDLSHANSQASPALPAGLSSVLGGVVTVTVDLSNYNAPVSVSVPPASQVSNLGDILGMLKTAGQLGSLSGLTAHL